jgi:glycosyltransferase involved in cell wall biosynthesis
MEVRGPRPLRILLVNYEYPPMGGGAANATMFIGRAMRRLGHEVTVLTGRGAGLEAEAQDEGVRIVRIRVLRRSHDRSNALEMASFLVSACLSIRRQAAAACPDGVIAFFTVPSGPAAWLLNAMRGVPYVVSLRGGDVPGLVSRIGWIHRLIAPVRRAVLRGACAVVANSKALRELSEAGDPIPVQVIPNGVDADEFHPSPEAAREGPLRLLFVGRLDDDHKNLSLLLREMAGTGAKLDIVGDGPDQQALHALSVSLGLAQRVTWHGWREKAYVARLYRESSCLVNPSRYEGMPNVVLEAMASGLPVIASDVGGNN